MKLAIAMVYFLLLGFSPMDSLAGTAINTIGSTDGVAIKGYDTVAFFTQKKAIIGTPEFTHEWAGARWFFVSDENLQTFKQNPEQWAPQYGGHCALGMSEGYISQKPTSGEFEVMDGKLYLFPAGDHRGSAYSAWRRYAKFNIPAGGKNWPALKEKLEAK